MIVCIILHSKCKLLGICFLFICCFSYGIASSDRIINFFSTYVFLSLWMSVLLCKYKYIDFFFCFTCSSGNWCAFLETFSWAWTNSRGIYHFRNGCIFAKKKNESIELPITVYCVAVDCGIDYEQLIKNVCFVPWVANLRMPFQIRLMNFPMRTELWEKKKTKIRKWKKNKRIKECFIFVIFLV